MFFFGFVLHRDHTYIYYVLFLGRKKNALTSKTNNVWFQTLIPNGFSFFFFFWFYEWIPWENNSDDDDDDDDYCRKVEKKRIKKILILNYNLWISSSSIDWICLVEWMNDIHWVVYHNHHHHHLRWWFEIVKSIGKKERKTFCSNTYH